MEMFIRFKVRCFGINRNHRSTLTKNFSIKFFLIICPVFLLIDINLFFILNKIGSSFICMISCVNPLFFSFFFDSFSWDLAVNTWIILDKKDTDTLQLVEYLLLLHQIEELILFYIYD